MESLFEQVESPTLRKLFFYLSGAEVSGELEDFLGRHCDGFEGEIRDLEGEQDLGRYDLYKQYTALLEGRMQQFCDAEGLTVREVFEECDAACQAKEDDGEDGNSSHMIASLLLDMLVAAADYNAFVINMSSFKRYRDMKKEMDRMQRDEGESKFADDGDEQKNESESKFQDQLEDDDTDAQAQAQARRSSKK